MKEAYLFNKTYLVALTYNSFYGPSSTVARIILCGILRHAHCDSRSFKIQSGYHLLRTGIIVRQNMAENPELTDVGDGQLVPTPFPNETILCSRRGMSIEVAGLRGGKCDSHHESC